MNVYSAVYPETARYANITSHKIDHCHDPTPSANGHQNAVQTIKQKQDGSGIDVYVYMSIRLRDWLPSGRPVPSVPVQRRSETFAIRAGQGVSGAKVHVQAQTTNEKLGTGVHVQDWNAIGIFASTKDCGDSRRLVRGGDAYPLDAEDLCTLRPAHRLLRLREGEREVSERKREV